MEKYLLCVLYLLDEFFGLCFSCLVLSLLVFLKTNGTFNDFMDNASNSNIPIKKSPFWPILQQC